MYDVDIVEYVFVIVFCTTTVFSIDDDEEEEVTIAGVAK